VDVGLPNSTYDFNSITATVNNQSIPTYNISQIDKGITVDLGSMAIQPGRSGTVYLRVGTISNLLYKSNKAGYAHFSFRPNWFGSDYVYGSTNVVVTLYLPAGMTSDEPIYDSPKSWPVQIHLNPGMMTRGEWHTNGIQQTAPAMGNIPLGHHFPPAWFHRMHCKMHL